MRRKPKKDKIEREARQTALEKQVSDYYKSVQIGLNAEEKRYKQGKITEEQYTKAKIHAQELIIAKMKEESDNSADAVLDIQEAELLLIDYQRNELLDLQNETTAAVEAAAVQSYYDLINQNKEAGLIDINNLQPQMK